MYKCRIDIMVLAFVNLCANLVCVRKDHNGLELEKLYAVKILILQQQ
jgi:hypothetical protein